MILRYYVYYIVMLIIYFYEYFPVDLDNNRPQFEPPIKQFDNVVLNPTSIYTASMKKLVLVVIDALREDFITEQYMPWLMKNLKRSGCILSTTVKPPTVTLPRIKSLTTGSVPQFADIVLNFASSELTTDCILKKFSRSNKKIVFYGDDTWLKLYPNMFLRSEGVNSFFVSDYIEVDNNITRNVPNEMKMNDWDFMILHYLGLDHIGHMYGPKNVLIKRKLKEMDRIVNSIYLNMTEDTLLIVTGDHGMRDSGGHGGTTISEIQVPTVFLGLKCLPSGISQVDIAPTLAALFGFSFPSDSIGRVLSNILNILPLEKRLYVLNYNFEMLLKRSNACDKRKSEISTLFREYYMFKNATIGNTLQALFDYCNQEMSQNLLTDVETHVSIIICIVLLCFHLFILSDLLETEICSMYKQISLEILLILFTILNKYSLLFFAALSLSSYIVYERIKYIMNCNKNILKNFKWLFITVLMHNALFLATSYIEEEHQMFYYAWGTICAVQMVKYFKLKTFRDFLDWTVIFVGLRIFRHLNRTGDKWADMPDISDWLMNVENRQWLRIFVIIGLVFLWYSCYKVMKDNRMYSTLSGLLMLLIYCYHFVHRSSFMGKILWLIIFVAFGLKWKKHYYDHALYMWLLMCSVVMRPYNIILLPACVFVGRKLHKSSESPTQCIWLHYWLGSTLFFCQGNGNNFAYADVATGYVGLREYNLLLVSVQVLINCYAFPIASFLLLLHLMPNEKDRICKIFAFCRITSMTVVAFVSYFHQNHLFVWSVFAPKLIIESVHCCVLLLLLFAFNVCDIIKQIY